MTMQCIKTGCHLYTREYQCSFLGDLYHIGDPSQNQNKGTYILKCLGSGSRSYEPIRPTLNCVVSDTFHFWQCGDWYICIFEGVGLEMYNYEGQELTGEA